MNIDRNNYEEYFLLYADNELTDSEKAEVLMFVKENKDLEEEFRTIHYTICKPDANVRLGDKLSLLRGNEEAFITEKNYEEVFVLYHDNELTPEQKKQTDDFLSRYASLKNEFELIGLARLAPGDAVLFPDKKNLYRKEKTGKVVPIIFWRALIAAVFIGCGIFITELYVQKGVTKPGIALRPASEKHSARLPVSTEKVLPQRKPVNVVAQSAKNNLSTSPKEIVSVKEQLVTSSKENEKQKENGRALVKTAIKGQKHGGDDIINQAGEKINNEVVEKVNDEVAVANKEIKNIPKEEGIPKEEISENVTMEPSKELTQNAVHVNEKMAPVPNAQNTSYVADPNDNGQNYVFYDITTEEFRKTKFASFLKKVKRVIARNNPISRLLPGDDRQVVAN